MRKVGIISFAAALLCGAAMAGITVAELEDGSRWASPAGCRVAGARGVSSVADGTFVLSAVTTLEVTSNATETVTSSSVVWQRVQTNTVDGASITNYYPGAVSYTPPPPWMLASEGWVTNTTSLTVMRRVRTGQTLSLTNAVGTVTCSGGAGAIEPDAAWLAPADEVVVSGTGRGRVFLFLEN